MAVHFTHFTLDEPYGSTTLRSLRSTLDAFDAQATRQDENSSPSYQDAVRTQPLMEDSNATARSDVAKIRGLLHDAAEFELDSRRSRPLDALDYHEQQVWETSTRHTRTHDARIAVKTTKRRAVHRRQFLEFRATVTRIPFARHTGTPALIAEFHQVATVHGLLTLPPAISYSAVINPGADIFRLIDRDDLQGVQQLLRSGKASVRDCDPFGRTALHMAAWNSHPDACALLIAEGADVDSITVLSRSALAVCCGIGYHQKLRLLLEAGADPTLLPGGQFYLANLGADCVRSVLRISAAYIDLALRDHEGRTLLLATAMTTANTEQADIMQLLLRAGAHVDVLDFEGNSCLHLLVCTMQPSDSHCFDSLKVLLLAGADLSVRNASGESAFDVACRPSAELGSFRRDTLCAAAIRVGQGLPRMATDDRLWTPPTFTDAYTRQVHNQLCDRSAADARTNLLSRIIGCADLWSPYMRYRLHEAAVDRTIRLNQNDKQNTTHPFQHFSSALQYLRSMIEGKRQLYLMIKERITYQQWRPYLPVNINWLQLEDEAETLALLGFDWFRPVDYEDLFATFVDSLIEQFQITGLDREKLVKVMEETVPSYRELSQRRCPTLNAERCHDGRDHPLQVREEAFCQLSEPCSPNTHSLPRRVPHEPLNIEVDSEIEPYKRRDSMSPQTRPRIPSIMKTPIEFYGGKPGFLSDETEGVQAHTASGDDGKEELADAKLCLAAGQSAKRGRIEKEKHERVASWAGVINENRLQ